jgi:rhombotail lipoprotein
LIERRIGRSSVTPAFRPSKNSMARLIFYQLPGFRTQGYAKEAFSFPFPMHFFHRVPVPTAILSALLLPFLSSCQFSPHGPRSDRTNSVVEYLYPKESNPLAETGVPVLRLPLRVGIAFVPPPAGGGQSLAYGPGATISELGRAALLERVARAFAGRDYIASIQTIPRTYLRQSGGFDNLDQIRRLLDIDVVALVSYDEVQFTDQNRLSFAYWTIVGAYLFKGNMNDTQTLMEASVYDIASRRLLFHAPGSGHVHANSTLIQVGETLRRNGAASLEIATDHMIENLTQELENFRERVKAAPDTSIKIEHKPGYTGAGDLETWFAISLVGIMVWVGLKDRRCLLESR